MSGKWRPELLGKERIKEYALMMLGPYRYTNDQVSQTCQILYKMLNEQNEKQRKDRFIKHMKKMAMEHVDGPMGDEVVQGRRIILKEAVKTVKQRRYVESGEYARDQQLKTPDWKQRLQQLVFARKQKDD